MYYKSQSFLSALEESVSLLSGKDISIPGDVSVFSLQPTIAIGPAFGTQLARGGGVEAIPQKTYVPPSVSMGPKQPAYAPSDLSVPASAPSGPDWTSQPGMLYAAGVPYTPQDFISKFGMPTYLEVGGRVASAPVSAPSVTPDFSSGSAPAQASRAVIGGPGLPLPVQASGPRVSTGAATLDMKQYFHQARQEIKQARGLPIKRGNLKDYAANDIAIHAILFFGLLYVFDKVRFKNK
jgi:hypothetical protein